LTISTVPSPHLTISPPAEKAAVDSGGFADAYCQLRQREGRLADDALLAQLPFVGRGHPHRKEWRVRQCSLERLLQHLAPQAGVLDILEVGCGNGWLSARLAANPNWRVTGTDINAIELQQAQRVFGHLPNLRFVQGDIRHHLLGGQTFDVIVFAASVQYFASLKDIVGTALAHSSLRGEVHIMDTAFYPATELAAARQRTIDYYTAMGFAQLADWYFHHSLQALEGFQYKLLHRPGLQWKGLHPFRHPFYHVHIKNHYL
jgi:SAM-dependent methyltransferase